MPSKAFSRRRASLSSESRRMEKSASPSAIPYPARCTRAIMSSRPVTGGSNCTVARSDARLTTALCTPFTFFKLRSIVVTQLAQYMPVMGNVICFSFAIYQSKSLNVRRPSSHLREIPSQTAQSTFAKHPLRCPQMRIGAGRRVRSSSAMRPLLRCYRIFNLGQQRLDLLFARRFIKSDRDVLGVHVGLDRLDALQLAHFQLDGVSAVRAVDGRNRIGN